MHGLLFAAYAASSLPHPVLARFRSIQTRPFSALGSASRCRGARVSPCFRCARHRLVVGGNITLRPAYIAESRPYSARSFGFPGPVRPLFIVDPGSPVFAHIRYQRPLGGRAGQGGATARRLWFRDGTSRTRFRLALARAEVLGRAPCSAVVRLRVVCVCRFTTHSRSSRRALGFASFRRLRSPPRVLGVIGSCRASWPGASARAERWRNVLPQQDGTRRRSQPCAVLL